MKSKRGYNFDFIYYGILNLMVRNYSVNKNKIDLTAEIDSKLSMSENWYNIKPKIIYLSHKINLKS